MEKNKIGIDVTKLTFEEALVALKKALAARYPMSGMTYFAYTLSGRSRVSTFGHFGTKRDLELAGTDIVMNDAMARDFVDDVFLNRICSIPSGADCKYESMKYIHDYAVDFAKDLGLDTTGVSYFTDHQKVEKDSCDQSYYKTKVNDVEAIAARIKMLEDETKSLKRSLDPMNKVAVLKAQAKQMRRAGDITGASEKDAEAKAIVEGIEKKRKAAAKRLENLKLARARKVELKKRREQAEKDRQKAQQFDPHRAAKAKMKKIKERQAERNASKKKASESKEWYNQPLINVIARLK